MGLKIKGMCLNCEDTMVFPFGGARLNFTNTQEVLAINHKKMTYETVNFLNDYYKKDHWLYTDERLKDKNVLTDELDFFDKIEHGEMVLNKRNNFCLKCHENELNFMVVGCFD